MIQNNNIPLHQHYQMLLYNPALADELLDLLNPDDKKRWFVIVGAHKNSGGSLEKCISWSLSRSYNDETQVRNAHDNYSGTADILTLIRFAEEQKLGIEANTMLCNNSKTTYCRKVLVPDKVQDEKIVINAQAMLEFYTNHHRDLSAEQLIEELASRSTIPIDPTGGIVDTLAMLSLYDDRDNISIPKDNMDVSYLSLLVVEDWKKLIAQSKPMNQFFVPNVHVDEERLTKKGKLSWRADACYPVRKYAIIEMDEMEISDQLRLYIRLIDEGCCPTAITYSGSKSVHALFPVSSEEEHAKLYQLLVPCGADSHCKNAGRLSRMPGSIRPIPVGTKPSNDLQRKYMMPDGKGVMQKLLYMNK